MLQALIPVQRPSTRCSTFGFKMFTFTWQKFWCPKDSRLCKKFEPDVIRNSPVVATAKPVLRHGLDHRFRNASSLSVDTRIYTDGVAKAVYASAASSHELCCSKRVTALIRLLKRCESISLPLK